MKKLLLQQNRFLALVSNVDYYKNALSLAENSEDAGTLQALKTMDSLESKIQQVKTSMEQFYSSMGIEKFLKGTLTTVNTVIKNINKMTKPQAFMTLINLFKGAKTMVLGGFQLASNKFGELKGELQNLKSEAASGTQINLENTTAKSRIEELKEKLAALNTAIHIEQTSPTYDLSKYANVAFSGAPGRGFNGDAALNWLDGIKTPRGEGSRNTYNYLNALANASGKEANEFRTALKGVLGENVSAGDLTTDKIVQAIKDNPSTFGDEVKGVLAGLEAQKDANTALLKAEQRNATVLALNRVSGILTSIGATVTAISLAQKDKSTDSVEGSKIGSGAGSIFSGLGSAAGSIASGLMVGGHWGAALAAVGVLINGLPSIVSGITQLIDGFDYNTAEKLAAATSEAEESKTEALKKKSEERNLKNDLERLKTLEAAQYDSAEAQQEYVDYMNQLADTYPNLVDSLKLTGDATITAIDMENALQDARKASAIAAAEAAKDEAERAKKEAENYQALEGISADYINSVGNIGVDGNKELLEELQDYLYGKSQFSEELSGVEFLFIDIIYGMLETMLNETKLSSEEIFGISQDDFNKLRTKPFIGLAEYDVEGIMAAFQHYQDNYDDIIAVAEEASGVADKASFKADIVKAISTDENYADYSDAAVELASRIFSDAATAAVEVDGEIDYDTATKEFEKLYKNFGAGIFAKLMGPNGEALFELVDNLDKYTPSDLKSKLKSLNFEPDENPDTPDIGDWVIQEQTKRYEEAQNLIAGKVEQIYKKAGAESWTDLARIDFLFNGEEIDYELPPQYADFFLPMLNQAESYFDNSLFAQGRAYLGVISSLGTALGDIKDQINSEDLQAIEAAFAKLDLTSANSIQEFRSQIETFAGEKRLNDFAPVLTALDQALTSLQFNIVTEVQTMADQVQSTAEEIEKFYSAAAKGYDGSDAIGQFQKIVATKDFKDLSFDDVFTFSEAQNNWVLTQEGFNASLAVERKKLDESIKAAETAKSQVSGFLGASVADEVKITPDTIRDQMKEGRISYAEGTAVSQLKKLLTDAGVGDNLAEELIQEYAKSDEESFVKFLEAKKQILQNSVDNFNALTAALLQIEEKQALSSLDVEGVMQGTADIETQKQLLKKAILSNKKIDINTRREYIDYLRKSDDLSWILDAGLLNFDQQSTGLKANIEKYTTALDELLKGPGTIISESTSILLDGKLKLDDAGHTIAATMDECITVALDVYKGLAETNISIAELNHSYASIITAQMSDYANASALGAGSFSIDTFGEILAAGNKKLEDYWDAEAKEFNTEIKTLEFDKTTQNVKIVAKSFDEFVNVIANLSGLAANEILAEETGYYKDLYSKYVDTQISQQTSSKKRLESQLQALSGAKIGDTINVSELEGILGQSQYTVDSMKQLYATLSQIAAKGGADIQASIAIIEEALASLFESWASAIAAGLGGTLSASQAEGLKKSFKLNDFDFTETAEGLQLSRAAAFEVYEQLEKIDKVKSKLVFDELANNLSETDENYANISKIMSRINELDSNVPTGRSKEYATELKLAQDILKTRSMTDADSFKLMDQDLPEAMQGPVNAWESMYKSYNAVNEGLKSGKMGIEDFYNFANNIVPMMEQAGVEVFDTSMSTADLVQRGFDALSYVDGEGLQVSLGDLGLNFAAGAADMQVGFKKGFDGLADSQIAMLDAAINMLEAIVAMEEIGDIAGENGTIELGELFELDVDGNVTGYSEKSQEFINKIIKTTETDEDLANALESYRLGGFSVLDLLKNNNEEITKLTKEQQEQLTHFIDQLSKLGSKDFTLENVQSILNNSNLIGLTATYYYDSEAGITLVGRVGEKVVTVEWDSESVQEALADTGLNQDEANELLKEWADGEEITPLKLTQVYKLLGDITISADENGNTIYHFLGRDYTDESELEAAVAEYDKVTLGEQNFEVKIDKDGKIVAIKKYSNFEVEISVGENGDKQYTIEGFGGTYSSEDEALKAYYVKQHRDGAITEDYQTWRQHITLGYTDVVIDSGKENLTPETRGELFKILNDPQKLGELIAEGKDNGAGGKTVKIPLSDGTTFTFSFGDEAGQDVIRDSILESLGIDTGLITSITTAIFAAFEGGAGDKIGEAIKTGIENSFKTTGINGTTDGYSIGEITLVPTAVKVDASSATVEPAEGEISLTNSIPEVKATADKITITLATNYEAAPGSVATGLEYETGEGTAEEVSVSSNSYKDANGTTIDDIKYELVNGNIDTITITAKKHEDSDQSPDLGDYTGTPTATADSAKVTVQEYEITFTDQDGNVTKTLTVSGTAELGGILGDIAGLTKSSEGNYQLAETIDNLTINVVMPNYDDVLKLIESLTGKKDLIIETSYVDSNGNPIIGQEEGALGYFGSGNQTVGYGVSGNNDQSIQSYGVYSSLSEAVKKLNALNNNPEVSQPEIQEIYADGSSITVPQATISVMSATLQNGQSGGGNPTRGSVSEQGQNGGNQGTSGGAALPGNIPDVSAAVSAANAQLSNLATAINRIPNKSGEINKTAAAINSLKDKKVKVTVTPIDAQMSVTVRVNAEVHATNATVKGTPSIKNPSDTFHTSTKTTVSSKGNVALAQGLAAASGKRTLVGELGPELVVSDGHYYTVGDTGAEFVNLPDDAIVFNHLQTRRLLGKKRGGIDSRGVPITNERRAVAFARGGETGPAMASADAVLSQLKQLRAMWQAMKDASASDLGSKAGGGGGGGGGGGKDDAFIEMIDRWYNYVRQIDNLEQHINLEEAKRKNLIDGYLKQGYSYAESLEQQLDYLKEQQSVYKDLATLQRDYYDKRQQELANSKYAQIFTYNDEGLQQYTQGKNKGIDALAFLNQQDAYGAAKLSAKKQYEYLVKELGFTYDDLKTDSSGKVAKKNDYAALVQNFFDNVDAWKDELDSLWDEVAEGLQNIEDNQAAQQEILQQFTDNQLSVEDTIMTALTDMRQKLIDDLQEELDELQDAGDKYIDDLTDALDRERKMYEDSQREKETASLQTQLAILKRTGASASSIRSLESQLDNRYQEDYFNEQQDQIDKVQESLDTQIERMEEQIKIETESLEYQKKNGLLWEQVYSMMATWGEGQLAQFIQEGTQSFHEKSPLGLQEEMKTILQQIQIYLEKSASDAYKAFLSETGLEGDDELKEAFMTAYGESRNIETATQAAQAIITRREEEQQRAPETPPAPPEPEQPTFNVIGTGKVKAKSLKVHKDSNVNSEQIGGVKEGQAVELLGKRGSWYKIVYNGQEGWVSTKWVSVKDDIKKKLPQFKEGGMVDFTGPAMVHGTKSKPEAFIDAEDTALLKSTIFSKSNNSLRAMIDSLNQFIDNISHHSGATNENITIENISLNFEPGVISNDYSAKRAGQTIKEEILSIARKAGNWSR